jgi:hypothetical protein
MVKLEISRQEERKNKAFLLPPNKDKAKRRSTF